ncbi:DUF5054 domain-containing protein [Pseudocitrobacter faecalis]|uniref:DUF5054 domain-containing protein n=1 Tax=Pseudocitrobacter faecalis TaxID=1398493 RepID=UPI0039EFFF84
MKRVHVIYKTHLDIGFTDFAEVIEDKYLNDFIPSVINLAQQVNRNGQKNFIWSCGSWLIHRYFQKADRTSQARLTEAINQGDIVWHALPFTTHSELLTPQLLQHGLSYSQALDARFGRRTIAAKMTDVPGHPQTLIPWLADAGVRYLHLGVNPASCPPDVPPLFLWKYGDRSLIVNYSFGGYGNETWCEALDELLVFCHAEDNCSPPSASDVLQLIDRYRERYPEAEVSASTLDTFAARLETIRHTLPVIEAEMGDTWNHGIGTDPAKVSRYRRLTNLLASMPQPNPQALDALLMIPEHTWGMDLKLHLGDYSHYLPEEFDSARKADHVTDPMPEKYAFIQQFVDKLPHRKIRGYCHFARSWQEQRNYLESAFIHLPDALVQASQPVPVEVKGDVTVSRTFHFGDYTLSLAQDGSLVALQIEDAEQLQAPFGRLIYRQVGTQEYDRFRARYMQNMEVTSVWSLSDFTKPGMELYSQPITTQQAEFTLHQTRWREDDEAWYLQAITRPMASDNLIIRLPEEIRIEYRFSKTHHDVTLRASIVGKQANRLPEEIWLQLGLADTQYSQCHKLGYPLSWHNIIKNGNRNLHAVESANSRHWTLEPVDAPLLALYEPRVLCFNDHPLTSTSLYGQLYNNIWGTNFPMWYDEDIHAEYRLRFHRGESE